MSWAPNGIFRALEASQLSVARALGFVAIALLATVLYGERASAQPPAPSAAIGGIGAVVGMRDGYPTVVRVIPGSPAEAAGLRPDDRIVRIDQHRTHGGYLPALVEHIRGAPGTTVTLFVARPKPRGGVSRARRVRVVRALLQASF